MRKLILLFPLAALALAACQDNNGANTSQTYVFSNVVKSLLSYGNDETMQPVPINILLIDTSDESADTYDSYFAIGS